MAGGVTISEIWYNLLIAHSSLTERASRPKQAEMEGRFKPDTQSALTEVAEVRETLDDRYDDIESGRVKPIDGEAFFESLRRREDELLKPRPGK